MAITIPPALESELRANAAAEGISVEEYLERLVKLGQQASKELETLITDAVESGDAVEPGPGYWEDKHHKLDRRLKSSR